MVMMCGCTVWKRWLRLIWALWFVPRPGTRKLFMLSESSYSPISRLLWLVTAFESAVLGVVGGGLFFLTEPLGQELTWELTPFNARFLGAVYLASLLSTLLLVVANRWSPARVVVPMIFLFTTIVLAVSVLNLSRFTGPLFATVLWFLLYVGIPLNAGYH